MTKRHLILLTKEGPQSFSSSHQRGVAETRTVEARGCPDPTRKVVSNDRVVIVGRAARALLTGQRQNGPIQDPAREEYPRVAHDGSGSYRLNPATLARMVVEHPGFSGAAA